MLLFGLAKDVAQIFAKFFFCFFLFFHDSISSSSPYPPISHSTLVESCLQLPIKVVSPSYLALVYTQERGAKKVCAKTVSRACFYRKLALIGFRFPGVGYPAWGVEGKGKFKFNNLKDKSKDDYFRRETCIFVRVIMQMRLSDAG